MDAERLAGARYEYQVQIACLRLKSYMTWRLKQQIYIAEAGR